MTSRYLEKRPSPDGDGLTNYEYNNIIVSFNFGIPKDRAIPIAPVASSDSFYRASPSRRMAIRPTCVDTHTFLRGWGEERGNLRLST